VSYSVRIDIDARTFFAALDLKSRRIIRAHLKDLETDPYPGKAGDKELLNLPDGVKIYRLHIGRTFTAYYEIVGKTVYVNEILTIEQAHKKYKRL